MPRKKGIKKKRRTVYIPNDIDNSILEVIKKMQDKDKYVPYSMVVERVLEMYFTRGA